MEWQSALLFILGVANVWLGWLLKGQAKVNDKMAKTAERQEKVIHDFKNEMHTINLHNAINFVPNSRFEKVMDVIAKQIESVGVNVHQHISEVSRNVDKISDKLDRKADK